MSKEKDNEISQFIFSTKELRRFRFPSDKQDEQFCDNEITTARYNA